MKVALVYNRPQDLIGPFEKGHFSIKKIQKEIDFIASSLARDYDAVKVEVPRDRIFETLLELKSKPLDIVFNIYEAPIGDAFMEVNVASIFELLEIPYTGSGPQALGLALDKPSSKRIFALKNIPTPKFEVFDTPRFEWKQQLSFPVIIKPIHEDASAGITRHSVVSDVTTLRERIETLIANFKQPVLVEEYIEGRELNVAVVGNDPPEVLPISEIDFSGLPEDMPNICTFEAKWVENSIEFQKTVPICPAELPESIRQTVSAVALKAYQAMGCRDYARVDIRLSDEGTPYVLEVNPNPDISPDAGFIRSAKAHGWSYDTTICNIVRIAVERIGATAYRSRVSDRKRHSIEYLRRQYRPWDRVAAAAAIDQMRF